MFCFRVCPMPCDLQERWAKSSISAPFRPCSNPRPGLDLPHAKSATSAEVKQWNTSRFGPPGGWDTSWERRSFQNRAGRSIFCPGPIRSVLSASVCGRSGRSAAIDSFSRPWSADGFESLPIQQRTSTDMPGRARRPDRPDRRRYPDQPYPNYRPNGGATRKDRFAAWFQRGA